MPQFRKSAKMTSSVSMASMSDIAFLLIIFFITASVFVLKDGILLMLPSKNKTMVMKKSEDIITVTLREDRAVILNDRPVPSGGIGDSLTGAGASGESLVLLRVQKKVPYQAAVSLIDALKQYGIRKISLKMIQ